MSKEDFYGFAGAAMCAFVGWYDESWRYFWFSCGLILGVWTIISLKK